MPVKKVGGFPGGGARWESLVLFVLAAVGIGWRLRNYLHAKSVWLDEVSLATEIMRLSLYELLTAPLERAQVAPPGYLMFSKLVTWCTAMNEFSLRLVPYVGSTVGVFIGWWFARRAKQLSLPARSVFLGLVAVSPVLGLYAAEAKQYGLDAVVTLGLLALVLPDRPLIERWKQLAIGGAVALWFSHPAVFTLAAIGIAVLAERESRSTDECRRRCLYLFGTWLAAFLLVFGPLYLAGGPSARLHTYWRTAFAPGWPSTWEELRWYPNSLLNYMQVAFGPARRYGIGAMDQDFLVAGTGFLILTTAGWFALRSVWPRMALVSALTLTGAVVGALLAVYPFRGRLLIYLLPIAFLNVGAYFHAWRRWWGIPTLLGAALIAVVLGGEVVRGWYQPFHSPQARLVMECIGRSQRSTDVYYLLPRTGSAFGFYRRRIDVHRRQMRNLPVNGEKKKEGPRFTEHLAQIVAASKTRVWLVGLHKPAPYFDQLRSTPLEKHRIVACKAHGAEAWLLSAAPNS